VRRWYLIVALAIAATGVALLALPRGQVWTTSSEEARSELEQGLDAQRKLYFDEAKVHFEKALALDPGSVIAKLFVAQSLDSKESGAQRKALLDEVRKADLGPLSARERFLIAVTLAHNDKDEAKAAAVAGEFLAKHPDDPYALYYSGGMAFTAGNWDDAARDYRRLAEVAPNFVLAYNQLGTATWRPSRRTRTTRSVSCTRSPGATARRGPSSRRRCGSSPSSAPPTSTSPSSPS
jgi:tetratricopeptide (TPR) repeat protein